MDLNTPISAIMTTEMTTVQPDQKLLAVKRIYEKKKFHHHIPVVEGNQLKGMISLADFLFAIKGATLDNSEPVYDKLSVADIMINYPVTMPSSSTLGEVSEELSKGEVHAVLIVDNGILKGIVSTADVIRHYLKENTVSAVAKN
jgi:CBS domain-containing protein